MTLSTHFSTSLPTPYISYWQTQFDVPETLSEEATILERLQHTILDGHATEASDLLAQAIRLVKADIVATECLLPTAQLLTEKFNTMEMLLPFVLQSAAILRHSWETVLPQCVQFKSPASCVMLTVQGDTHEVGKNIVDTLLQAHGITVRNLGSQVTRFQLLEAITTHQPDAVVMSGLLIESAKQMKLNISALVEAGIDLPVILGGPALTPAFVLKECRPLTKSPVLHARTAMDTLAYLQGIGEAKSHQKRWHPPANAEPQPPSPNEMMNQAATQGNEAQSLSERPTPRTQVNPALQIPVPPFWGVKVVEDIPLEAIYQFLNAKVLMSGHWGFRRWDKTPEEQEGFIQSEIQPLFDALKSLVEEQSIFTPKVVYGYFPATAEGDEVVIYDPHHHQKEIRRFKFPRGGQKNLCLSDYLIETQGDQKDVLALQLVSMGQKAADFDQTLFAQGNYMLYYLYHGFSVEMAEALAEYWHAQVRCELQINQKEAGKSGLQLLKPSAYQGGRYSFGYPACPNLSDQTILMDLLDGEQIGVRLSESFMLIPEQSTSALVFHHPEAYYFDVTQD
jgi:5-methyltetrahydrofolate--homocysteine methyltransferase